MTYDSRPETYAHSQRVGELIIQLVKTLLDRSTCHDRSKTEAPELEIFNEHTPKLKGTTYGSDEYKGYLAAMSDGLKHHYEHNRHHPEFGECDLEWRPVVGYEEQYEVSNYGDLCSLDRVIGRQKQGNFVRTGQPIKTYITPKGYLRVMLSKDGAGKNYLVHRLVADAFLEPRTPDDNDAWEINHRNGNKADNYYRNLEWVTPSENLTHAYANGLKEPAAKYIVHCLELDLTTLGMNKMAKLLQGRGHPATAAGIWGAAHRTNGKHCGLTFEATLLAEYQRSRISHMTLVDLIEMLADWKAATERHADGSLRTSLMINADRFGISEQLQGILRNTAQEYLWM